MKAIILTQEQKDKLLEMCKELFPKYNFGFYHPISEASMLVGFLKTNDSDVYDNCDIFIHWFEFCMTHLATKLPISTLRLNACFNGIKNREHIIDYLYSIFKSI